MIQFSRAIAQSILHEAGSMMRPAQVEALNGLSIDGLEFVADNPKNPMSMQAYYQEIYIGTAFNDRFDAWHGLRGSNIASDLAERIRKAYLE